MMRAILGSAIGGVVAGAVALVASAQGRSAPEPVWPTTPAAVSAPYAMTVAQPAALNTATTAAPTFVQCEPTQEAVMQRSIVGNREVAQVTCVTRTMPAAAPYYGQPAGYVQPVSYVQPDIVQRPAARSVRRTQRTVVRETAPKRSWQKTALIIGGSTGAGAGIGGIAGGKKGALIGAAIGGGAASIYEAVKRR
jgi:hypothetical protein